MVGMLDWLTAGAQDYGQDLSGFINGTLKGPEFANRRRLADRENAEAYAAGGTSSGNDPATDIPIEETGNPFHRDLDAPQVVQAAKSFYGPKLVGMLNGFRSINERPKSASPLGEPAGNDGEMLRPGSILHSLFGGGSAEAAPAGGDASLENVPGLPPSTNDPMSAEPQVFKDGVPLPRPRPITPNTPASVAQDGNTAGAPTAGNAPLSMAPQAMDANAQAAPSQPQPQPGQGGGIGGMLGNLLRPENAPLLLSLAGGFAGAPSFGTGMRRAFSGAAPAAESARKAQIQQQGITATVQALIAKGVPPQDAIAAALNPDLMKATAAKYFEARPRQHVMMKDALGGETPMSYDPNTGKYYDAAGQEHKPDADGGGGAGGGGILAPGVQKIDQTLSGEEYLGQFSKDIQVAAKAYINGDAMPTGNPRMRTLWNFAKTVAQRYSQDIGQPYSDNEYNKKRQMVTDIARSQPNSMGGILSNGKSAFGHLANLSDKFTDLGNYSGPSMPFGGHVGTAANYAGNVLAPSPETKGKIQAVEDNALKYGQESTKFYAGTGGGAAERMHALSTMNPRHTTAEEQAAFLQTEKELMMERIHQKEAQIHDVMGPGYLERHPVVDANLKSHIDKIDANIQKLRGKAVPAAPAAAPAQASPAAAQPTPIPGVGRDALVEEARRRGLIK